MKTTSLQAYENKKPTIPTDQQRILSVLSETKEMTYNEIANKLNWGNPNKASRRMKELIDSKKIKYGEERNCKIVGNKCNTYLLNDKYE